MYTYTYMNGIETLLDSNIYLDSSNLFWPFKYKTHSKENNYRGNSLSHNSNSLNQISFLNPVISAVTFGVAINQ